MATWTTPATSERLTDLHNATAYDGLLKEVYLPGLTDTVFNDATFTRLIQGTTEGIDFEGQRIIKGFKHQRAGGIGAIAEGGEFVDSVPQKGQQGHEFLKYLNAYFQITGPAVRAAQGGAGSFVNAATDAFEDMMTNAKNDLERQLTGNGDGSLAICNEAIAHGDLNGVATDTINVKLGGYTATQFFREGMKIDILKSNATEIKNATDVSGLANRIELTVDSIVDADTISVTYDGTPTWDTPGTVAGDLIVPQGAYSSLASTGCLEINGLRNLMDDSASVWNLSRTTYPFLKSSVKALNEELSEATLLEYLIEMQFQHQGTPNLFLVSPLAMLTYFTNVVGTGTASTNNLRRFNVTDAMEWVGGYTGLGIQLGSMQLMLTSLGSVRIDNDNADKNSEAYLMNTADFAFASMTSGYEWLTPGGRVLQQKEGSDNQFATAVNYLNFVCYDPKRQMKITGVDGVHAA